MQREFDFADKDTCKQRWTFTLSEDKDNPVIERVEYKANLKDEPEAGCQGHPKTICVLLKGAALKSLDLEALRSATCARSHSCAMSLAESAEALLEETK